MARKLRTIKQNTRKHERKCDAIIAQQQRLIDRIYSDACHEAGLLGAMADALPEGVQFTMASQPALRARGSEMLRKLQSRLEAAIVNGVRSAWTIANNKNDELVRAVVGEGAGSLTSEQAQRYYRNNEKALEAFIARRDAGMDLSSRVWNYTDNFKELIERGLELGIREGADVPTMARNLKDYLKHPDKLFRRVRQDDGSLGLSQAAQDFHPGKGVYRSSYKNAMRLARTETNMAYRTADYDRIQDLDFVVGIKVVLSNNHTCLGSDGQPHMFYDICDELKGIYPKDFKFVGWHPHCRCHTETVLKSEQEILDDNARILNGEEPLPPEASENAVTEVPENFASWVKNNSDRIQDARSLPYFLRDNQQYVQSVPAPELPVEGHFMSLSEQMPADMADQLRCQENRRLFEQYKADPNYVNVKYDETTGGMMATHINHHPGGEDLKPIFMGLSSLGLEQACQREAYRLGCSAVLLDENIMLPSGNQGKSLDIAINGKVAEIRSIKEDRDSFANVFIAKNKQIRKYNQQQGTNHDTLCLYFHDPSMYSEDRILTSIESYRNNRNIPHKEIKNVLCVVRGANKIYEYSI